MSPQIEAIFIAATAGAPILRVREILAIAGSGLEGDRYAANAGHYSRFDDVCEVTLIEGEVLDEIHAIYGLRIHGGEHRRNIVTRGVSLRELPSRRLQIGDVLLEYDRPRPPCAYVERLTENGMTRALGRGAGIGVRVLNSGLLREGATIEILESPEARPMRRLP